MFRPGLDRAYHWTSKRFARGIEETGLWSECYMCRYPWEWRGEVCFEVTVEGGFDWENAGKDEWQRVNFDERIEAEQLRRLVWWEVWIARVVRQLKWWLVWRWEAE